MLASNEEEEIKIKVAEMRIISVTRLDMFVN